MAGVVSRLLLLAGILGGVLLVAVAGVYAWVYLSHPCDVDDVRDASTFLEIQLKRYDDVYISATSGTPDSLTYPVTVLQQILVDTQEVDVPACMQTAQDELLAYMGAVIRALQSYNAGEDNATVRVHLGQSYAHYDRYSSEVAKVNQCAPFCFPWSGGMSR